MSATISDSSAWAARPAAEFSSQRAVRKHNLGLVLRHVIEAGPRSRATIAYHTGLNKATVSRLVSELLELGLLVETGVESRSSVGRPGHMLAVAPEGAVGIGLEVNIDYLGVRATDLAGRSRYRALETADNRERDVEVVIDRLAELARDALYEVRAQGLRPIGATVALPGLVDTRHGILLTAPNLRWAQVPVVSMLRERIGEDTLPLQADNEANLAALAELWEGVASGVSDFIYASGHVGVGGGVILNGQLFRGYRGFGGEFGHMTVAVDGPPCTCGSRGCLETLVGLESLLGMGGDAATTLGTGRRVANLARRARAGDPDALSALADSGRWLGVALGNAVNLLSLETIVLGGSFAPIAEWLAPAILKELETRVLSGTLPTVLASTLAPEAAVRGAAATQLRRVIADPTLVAA
jgi:predicted NBD/HSP70 family sugar kinase